jgi:hypothetical protein
MRLTKSNMTLRERARSTIGSPFIGDNHCTQCPHRGVSSAACRRYAVDRPSSEVRLLGATVPILVYERAPECIAEEKVLLVES